MRTLSVLAALLVLGGITNVSAKTQVITLDGFCDELTLNISKINVVGADTSICTTGMGIGYISKVKGFGKAIVAGAQFSAAPGAQFVIRIAYPLVTGGNWDLALTTDGTTFTPYESGTYTVGGTPARGVRGTTPVAGGSSK